MPDEVIAAFTAIAKEFVMSIAFEYVKHLRSKLKGDKFASILRKSLGTIAKRLEDVNPILSEFLTNVELQSQLVVALNSPELDEKLVKNSLLDLGLKKNEAKKLCKEIISEFELTLEKEASKKPEVFREFIVHEIKKLDVTLTGLIIGLQNINKDIPIIISLVEDFKKQSETIEEISVDVKDVHADVKESHKKLDEIISLLLTNDNTKKVMDQLAIIGSKSEFTHDLDLILFRLFENTTISKKVSSTDKRIIIERAKNFKNWWHYLNWFSDTTLKLRKEFLEIVKATINKLSDNKEEVNLKIILYILSINFDRLIEQSKKIENKKDFETQRLYLLLKEAEIIKKLLNGETSEAETILDNITSKFMKKWKIELTSFRLFLYLQKGFSEKDIPRILGLIDIIKTDLNKESVAFIVGHLAEVILNFGQKEVAKNLLDSFEVDKYYPDFGLKFNLRDAMLQGKEDLAKTLFKKLAITGKFMNYRQYAQFSPILLDINEKPVECLKALDTFINELRPEPELLARAFSARGIILKRMGFKQDAEKMLDNAIEVLNANPFWSISAQGYKTELLIEKASSLIITGETKKIKEIIDEIEKLPLWETTKFELLALKAKMALLNRNFIHSKKLGQQMLSMRSDTRSKLRHMHIIIQSDFGLNNIKNSLDLLENLKKPNNKWAENAKINQYIAQIYYDQGKYEEALDYFKKIDLAVNDHNPTGFINEFGIVPYAFFLKDFYHVKLVLAHEHTEILDFETALQHLDSFSWFLSQAIYFLKKGILPLQDADFSIRVGLKGVTKKIAILEKYGQTKLALNEIDQLLKLNLTNNQKAQILMLKSQLRIKKDPLNAEKDLEKALEYSESDQIKEAAILQKIKLEFLTGKLSNNQLIIDEIEKLNEAGKKINAYDSLGAFFLRQGAFPIAEFCIKKGLEYIKEKTQKYRRFLTNLGSVYLSTDPEKALSIYKELEKEFKKPHEQIMFKTNIMWALLQLERFDELKTEIKDFSTDGLTPEEFQEFYRIQMIFAKKNGEWEKIIKLVNEAIKQAISIDIKNDLWMRKVESGLELSNYLLASDTLENVEIDKLSKEDKLCYLFLKQKVVANRQDENEAMKVFIENIPLFH